MPGSKHTERLAKRGLAVMVTVVICFVGTCPAAQFVDYQFTWVPRPQSERIETYWIWRTHPTTKVKQLAAVTSNRSSAWATNINTAIDYLWTISASNRLGMSVEKRISPHPSAPHPPIEAAVRAVRMRVPLGVGIEQGPTLKEWTERFSILPAGSNHVIFTYELEPDAPYMFWRWSPIIHAAECPKKRSNH